MATATGLRLLTWWLFPNIHQSDEIFQYQEQAFQLVDGYGVVPWEYIEGTRAWHVPGLLAGLLWLAERLPGGAALWPILTAITLSVLSLSIVWVTAAYGRWLWGLPGAVLAGGLGVVWFEFVYFAPKTLTTPMSTHLMLVGLLVLGLGLKRVSRNRLILGGALLGTAFVVRPQLAPGLVVLAIGIIWIHGRRRSAGWVMLGGGGALMLFGLIDLFAFDYPYQWLAQSIDLNITRNMTGQFGTDPWYWYFRIILRVWLYAAPVLLVLFLIGAKKLLMPGIAAAVIVLSHTVIAHKEYRFIYAAVVLALIVGAAGAAQAAAWLSEGRAWSLRRKWVLVAGMIGLLGVVSVARSLSPPYDQHWQRFSPAISAFDVLRDDPTLESLTVDVMWTSTPGYSGLRRDVPLHVVTGTETIPGLLGTYTHLLTWRGIDEIPPGHETIGEWPAGDDTLFLYRYAGDYVGPPALLINEQIRVQWDLFETGRSDRISP
jgi:hypothetical protein